MGSDSVDFGIHDDVVVETEVVDRRVALPAVVTNVLDSALWLVPRRLEPSPLSSLEPGRPLHLTFLRDGAAVVAESTFLRRVGHERLGAEASRVFAVSRPEGIEAVQRRAHVRVDVERRVYMRLPPPLSGGPARLAIGKTVNVSVGGLLQVVRGLSLELGQSLAMALVLDANEIVSTQAQVVRLEEVGDEGARRHSRDTRVALKFEKMSEADRERIACHILSINRRKRMPNAGTGSLRRCAEKVGEMLLGGEESAAPA